MTKVLDAAEQTISDEVLPARAYWHRRLEAGDILRIVDLHGCQAVDTSSGSRVRRLGTIAMSSKA